METLKLNTTTLMNARKEIGLEINANKTKQVVSCGNDDVLSDSEIEGTTFETVEKFRYLASTITQKRS